MAKDTRLREQVNASFRFVVDIDGQRQAAFTECTLPSIEVEIEELREGGLNSYVHQLPGRRKAAKVTLKNGIGKNELLDWYIRSLSEPVDRKQFTITLLDLQRNPVLTWTMENAYPVRWNGPNLKSDNNAIAIQSLELVCGEVSVTVE